MVHEVPKALARWLGATAVVVSLAICAAIGYAASPRDTAGRPVLLSLDVRAAETYRRTVEAWDREWQGQLVALKTIVTNRGELFAISQETQQIYTRAIELSGEVDATDAPAAMIGLHDQAQEAGQGCATAALAIARWVSAPSDDNRAAAEQDVAAAELSLTTLEANQWLQGTR